jgi:hypothetical protein
MNMHKRTQKKLAIRRETARVLSDNLMHGARGGVDNERTDSFTGCLTMVRGGCDGTQMPPCLSNDGACHSWHWCTMGSDC